MTAVEETSPEFEAAKHSLLNSFNRPELSVQQIPAPKEIAEHAIAFAASVEPAGTDASPSGTGRFVLFWSPEPQENWTTRFRIVIFARSPIETDIGIEAESADWTWAWLTDALAQSGADYSAIAGTTTRIISNGHGHLQHDSHHAEIELRASWSPHSTNVGTHFEAWQNLICAMSDLPLAHGVESIESRRLSS